MTKLGYEFLHFLSIKNVNKLLRLTKKLAQYILSNSIGTRSPKCDPLTRWPTRSRAVMWSKFPLVTQSYPTNRA